MKKNSRHITAALLAAFYILIALMPLSPLLLKSAHIAHAVTGECSGDCDIDGCSLESRVNHTCCCWQKKQTSAGLQQKTSTDSCCTPSATTAPVSAGGCCATPVVVTSSNCCPSPATLHDYHDHEQSQTADASESARDTTGQTVWKCGSPCGNNKILTLVKLSTDEIIPYHFVAELTPATVSPLTISTLPSLSSRTIEPPKPPPRLSINS